MGHGKKKKKKIGRFDLGFESSKSGGTDVVSKICIV